MKNFTPKVINLFSIQYENYKKLEILLYYLEKS